MSVTTIIGEGFGLANRIIDMINDPATRAKARRDYEDTLQALRQKIYEEMREDEADSLMLELISAVHGK